MAANARRCAASLRAGALFPTTATSRDLASKNSSSQIARKREKSTRASADQRSDGDPPRQRRVNAPSPGLGCAKYATEPAPAIDPRRRGIIEVTAIDPRSQSTRAGAGTTKSSRIHPRQRAQRSSAEPYRAHVYAHDALAIGHGGLVRVRGASDDVKRRQVLLARMARACRRPLSGTNVP